MEQFKLPISTRQEEFSLAFLHAITASAGYSFEYTRVDMDAIDVNIMQRIDGEQIPHFEMLRVQIKCTYSHRPNNGFISYPLKVDAYNKLRQRCTNPRILMVVYVPESIDSWIQINTDCLTLYHSAYWLSLLNYPVTNNQETVTVKVPTSQKLTSVELSRIMTNLARGTLP